MVESSLSMREVRGSIPCISTLFSREFPTLCLKIAAKGRDSYSSSVFSDFYRDEEVLDEIPEKSESVCVERRRFVNEKENVNSCWETFGFLISVKSKVRVL